METRPKCAFVAIYTSKGNSLHCKKTEIDYACACVAVYTAKGNSLHCKKTKIRLHLIA